jgi:NADH-quinone oxidoreductase subunit I
VSEVSAVGPAGAAGPAPLRGVIALDAAACTSCLICVRECPVWCITLTAHEEPVSPVDDRRPRTKAVLDTFEIDYGTCMYCGICVDTCPFDALSWAPDIQYAAATPKGLRHGIDELEAWRQR